VDREGQWGREGEEHRRGRMGKGKKEKEVVCEVGGQ